VRRRRYAGAEAATSGIRPIPREPITRFPPTSQGQNCHAGAGGQAVPRRVLLSRASTLIARPEIPSSNNPRISPATIDRSTLEERIGLLPDWLQAQVDAGLQRALGLARR
jgi:hypothetical protein